VTQLEPQRLRATLAEATSVMVDDLHALVECESPSSDLAALTRCADVVSGIGARLLGALPRRVVIDGRPHLQWRFGEPTRVLLLGHFDTVWPLGSLREHPFRVVDGRATGPGSFDMKAGLVQLLHALSVLPALAGVEVMLTADEEIGAPTSRPIIERSARQVRAALILEGSADGALKVARKGISHYTVHVLGRAAHAGLDPHKGVNAAVEIAHQVLAIAKLGDADAGTTVTPAVVRAGTTANTVPAAARVSVDVRANSVEEQQRVRRELAALSPHVPGAQVWVEDGAEHPPMTRTASRDLFAQAQQAADLLGLAPLRGVAVGGASDGNLTAGVGTPTLDGLGAVGGGAHADDEHVSIAAMPERAALVSLLTAQVQRGEAA
jgi:glutamate carboxypeptidase